jgi:phosphoglycolate phosphatase-like HAD superfamily hydrolase
MGPKTQIFFDLDGPVLDISSKYYHIYKYIVTEMGGRPMPKVRYWHNKRNKIAESQLLKESNLPKELIHEYSEKRKILLETSNYLKLDTVWPDLFEYMQNSPFRGLITLVTLRHNRKALENELNFLGISSWFTSVLSSDEGQNEISRHSIKTQMIRAHFKSDVNGWFVGDTETDLRAGKDLGLYCVATSFGIRTREILSRESPNQIISCPRDFVIWLKSIENESSFLRSKSTVSFP